MSAASNKKVRQMRVEVRFYANLSRYATGRTKDEAVTLETATGGTVADVLRRIGVPDDVETTVLIDGRRAQSDSVVGDGDFYQGAMALWTAAHYKIPVLLIVCNNRSNLNDEIIQEKIALERGRPVENRWIGQKIDDPAIDVAALARAQGVDAVGPVATIGELPGALERAFAVVAAGQPCVVDMVVDQQASASTFSEGDGEEIEGS